VRFTVIDLAVTVGVTAVLTALCVPCIAHSGESARRAQCQNNLKNVILAARGFEARSGGLPPAKTYRPIASEPAGRASISSIYGNLLNDLDSPDLYNSFNFAVPMYGIGDLPAENRTVAGTKLPILCCPNDPSGPPAPYAPTNYRANVGLGDLGPIGGLGLKSPESTPRWRGAFDEMRIVALAEFTDGTSATLAFSEKLVGSGRDPFDPARDWVPAAPPGAASNADGWSRICSSMPASAASIGRTDAGRCWVLSGSLYTTYRGSLPPNSVVPDCGSDFLNGVGAFGPRSGHQGGVNAAWADGSVRFIQASIEPNLWRSLQTRQGSDPSGDGGY
jgi:prepilin-type processing-associated H-X9-DG protein